MVAAQVPVETLVRQAQLGDKEAFAGLARRFLKASYAVALSIVGRKEDAEDISQDAFVTALSRIDTCRNPERFAGWLMQIVRNKAKNHLVSRRLRDVPREVPKDQPSVAQSPEEQVDTQRRLLDAMNSLTPIQREVVLLQGLLHWSHTEIADATGISEGMSRQHLWSARTQLKKTQEESD